MDRGLMTVIGSYQVWPEGLTWVFQGTVAEDATAGTHICSLTVTPGVGNEMEVLYGGIIVGNTATAQVATADIDDGTNLLIRFLNPGFVGNTVASLLYNIPQGGVAVGTSAATMVQSPGKLGMIVSGTQRLILRVQTAAVSVTQTFAVVCRIKGSAPTATLADTVGTPVLTVNTSKVFG